MATPEFHCFSSLPFELRQEIYLWATPPRVVQVEERLDEEYEEFLEEIRNVPNRLTLDSSLVYFASHWRHKVPRRRQPSLESFGFTNDKPARRPWTPSSFTPEIPIDWLDENPRVAWELARNSHLHSNAPIPALLHVCRDSRASLMQTGYQLAFRTRSSPPRTWFNFSRDSLFIGYVHYYGDDYKFLNGGKWDFGQFSPGDMQMVQKLVLSGSSLDMFQSNPSTYELGNLSPVFPLFPRLQELIFAEWTDSCLQEWAGYSRSTAHVEQATRARDHWVCRPVEDIDSCFHLFSLDSWLHNSMRSTGEDGLCVVAHKRKNGLDAPYHEDTARLMETAVAQHINSLDLSESGIPIIPWKSPKFTIAHVLSSTAYEFLNAERGKMAETLCHLQDEWSSIRRSRDSIAGQSSQEKEAEEAFVNLHWPHIQLHNCTNCAGWCYEQRQLNIIKKWWIEESLPMYYRRSRD